MVNSTRIILASFLIFLLIVAALLIPALSPSGRNKTDESASDHDSELIATAEILSVNRTIAPEFTGAVQVNGDVRVTLLQVSRVTSFLPYHIKNVEQPQDFAEGLEIIIMVEHLSDDAWDTFHMGGVEFFENGKLLLPAEGYVGGGYGVLHEYSKANANAIYELPSVDNPEETRIERRFLRGLIPSGNRVDIEINVGFGVLETFKFVSVPI